MYLASFAGRLVTDVFQFFHWRRVSDAYFCGEFSHAVNGSVPYDVLYVDVVADKHLAVVVNIDNSYEAISMLSEIIEKRRVLTEWIVSVVWIVHRRLVVAEEQDDAAFDEFF